MRISSRLWIGFGVIFAGYILTVAVGVIGSVLAANRLQLVREQAFPDMLRLVEMSARYRGQLAKYESAVTEGEVAHLKVAHTEATAVCAALEGIAQRDWPDASLRELLGRVAAAIRSADLRAQEVYGKLARNQADDSTRKGSAELNAITRQILEREFTFTGDAATSATSSAIEAATTHDPGLLDRARLSAGGILSEIARAGHRQQIASIAVMIAVLILASVMVTLIIRRSFNRPLAILEGHLAVLAGGGGDLTRRLPVAAGSDGTPNDELATLAATVNRMLENLQALVKHIGGSATSVGGASTELNTLAQRLATDAEAGRSSAKTSAEGTSAVVADMQSVGAAVQEMTASISEIARTAQETARTTQDAVAEAAEAGKTVDTLSSASAEIAQVAGLIASIAGKTNLLALNATIEAARAGEHGRGFAVVAAEVKDLARQTASATADIRQRVEAIKAGSSAAAEAILRMSKAIETINQAATSIAAAVEEQTATTQEMAQAITGAVDKVNRIGVSVDAAARASEGTAAAAADTDRAAKRLGTAAGELNQTVGQFTT